MRRSPRRPWPIEPGAADALRAEHFTAVHRAREAVTGAANAGDYRFRLASGSDKLDPQECRFPCKATGRARHGLRGAARRQDWRAGPAGRRALDAGSRATRAAGPVTSRAAGVQPRECFVRGAAARTGVEMLARFAGLGRRRPVRGQPREPWRVPRAPIAGEVRQELAVDGGVGPLEQPGVLALGDPERRHDLVGGTSLEVAHRPHRTGPPLDGEQDVRDDRGHLAALDLLADRRPPVGDRVDAGAAVAVRRRGELVVGGRGMAALAAQLHLALVDDHLAKEGAWVADRLAVAFPHPGGGHRDLEQVPEGVTSPRAAHPERPGQRQEERVLKLAVAGQPGARVSAWRGCCRAHPCLPREKCWALSVASGVRETGGPAAESASGRRVRGSGRPDCWAPSRSGKSVRPCGALTLNEPAFPTPGATSGGLTLDRWRALDNAIPPLSVAAERNLDPRRFPKGATASRGGRGARR